MNNKFYRIISLVMAIILVVSVAPVNVFAITEEDGQKLTAKASNVTVMKSDEVQTVDVVHYLLEDAVLSSIGVHVTINDPDGIGATFLGGATNAVSDITGGINIPAGGISGAVASYDQNAGHNLPYSDELEGYIVTTIPIQIPANAVGTFTVTFSSFTHADFDSGYGYEFNNESATATITVEEPAAPAPDYEIYYTLSGSSLADSADDAYTDYNIDDTVTAEIFLKNNTDTALTLQAYDIYLDYHAGLKYASHTMTGAVALTDASGTAAAAGAAVTHIEAVGEKFTAVALSAKGEVSLGSVSFTVDKANANVKYDTPLNIGFRLAADTENTAKTENVTNFSVGSEATGDKKSYYPSLTGNVLGAEVMTKYTVSYNANSGENAPAEQIKYYNVPLNLTTDKPTRDGYAFLGWSTDSGDNSVNAPNPYTGNEDKTFYAVWEQTTFTVTWLDQNGSKIYDEQVNAGDIVAFDDVNYSEPSKAADEQYTYTFKGWTTTANPALNAEVVDLTGYPIDETTTFYPVFSTEINTYTVTWFNGATQLEKDDGERAVAYNGTPSYDSGEPAMTGDAEFSYSFKGWTTVSDPAFDADVVDLENYKVTGNTNFYAVFIRTVNKYNVTFSTAHGTAPVAQFIAYGSNATNPGSLAADHYIFGGWYTDNTYTTEYDFNTQVITGETTIYAKWSPKTYIVTFNANGGTGDEYTQDFIYGETNNLMANAFTAPTGKSFQNWNTNPDGSGQTYAGGESITRDGNLTLYAQWTIASYTVKVAEGIQNGTVAVSKEAANYQDEITLTITPNTGYELDTLTVTDAKGDTVNVADNKFTMPDANVTVKATFKLATYKVTVADGIVNGNVTANPTEGKMNDEISLTVTPETGYKVKSVSYTQDGQSTAVEVTKGENGYAFKLPAGNVTVTAEFEQITYTIAFDGNGSSSGTMNPITGIAYGTETKLTKNGYTRDGYEFAGWLYNSVEYNDEALVKELTDVDGATVTMVAQWTAASYDVVLNPNGGTVNSGDVTEYTYGVGATLPTDVTKIGHIFKGWYTDSACSDGNEATKIGKDETGKKEFWAKWIPEEYTVTYNAAGGTVDPGSQNYTYGEGISNLPQPTKPGYNFTGWVDEQNNPVPEIDSDDLGDMTLTATWILADYEITFNLNGGAWPTGVSYTDNKMPYTIESTETLPTAERANYTFDGWLATAVGNWTDTVHNAGTSIEGKYGNVTLTAQWSRTADVAVEEYKYAYTGYWMLRVDATGVDGKEYKFGGESMFYMSKEDDTNGTYLLNTDEDSGVFYTLIPVAENNVIYVDTVNGVLTEAGYNKLTLESCTARATINYDGDINGDTVVNIADANVVYQMTLNGGSYYTEAQLDTLARLKADMAKEYQAGSDEHRGSIADVEKIVNIINGVPNN